MPSMTLEAARADFPGARGTPYLNVASRGVLATDTVAAIDRVLAVHRDGVGAKEDWATMGERARARFAELIGASPAEIAFTNNTASGLNIAATSFPWKAGDNVVLCPALEHPNNIYAWLNLRSRGVEVRTVEARQDAIDAEAILAAIDDRTRVVTLALVSFTPGFRMRMDKLVETCRKRDIFLVVDAVQCCGVLRTDVDTDGIDALATATSKGLLGIYGFGFLYVRQRWIDRLHPAYLARFSVDQGGAHESEMGGLDFTLQPDARRFEVGHYAYAGVAAADASLARLLAVGPEVIEKHALGLSAMLREGLAAMALPVCLPPTPQEATHIVTVGHLGGGGAYETADPRLNILARHLESAGVRFSVRRGLLRFATHLYNTEADIARVLDLARERGAIAAE